MLNLTISWSRGGLVYEADPRHSQLIVQALGLNSAKPVNTPIVRDGDETEDAGDDEHELCDAVRKGMTTRAGAARGGGDYLEESDSKAYRSIVARCNYLAADRPDIQYATRICSRGMAHPNKEDWRRLKRPGRYLAGHPVAKCHYEWQRHPQRVRIAAPTTQVDPQRRSATCVKEGS